MTSPGATESAGASENRDERAGRGDGGDHDERGSSMECAVCMRTADCECDRCGTEVCRMHYDGLLGFCGECASRVKPDDRRGDTFHL